MSDDTKHDVLGQGDYLRRDFNPCTSHSAVHGLKSVTLSKGINSEVLSIESIMYHKTTLH